MRLMMRCTVSFIPHYLHPVGGRGASYRWKEEALCVQEPSGHPQIKQKCSLSLRFCVWDRTTQRKSNDACGSRELGKEDLQGDKKGCVCGASSSYNASFVFHLDKGNWPAINLYLMGGGLSSSSLRTRGVSRPGSMRSASFDHRNWPFGARSDGPSTRRWAGLAFLKSHLGIFIHF